MNDVIQICVRDPSHVQVRGFLAQVNEVIQICVRDPVLCSSTLFSCPGYTVLRYSYVCTNGDGLQLGRSIVLVILKRIDFLDYPNKQFNMCSHMLGGNLVKHRL